MINPMKRSTETSVSERCFCEVGVSATPVYGGFHSHGVPLYRWMVLWENPSMDDNWVYPYFRKPQIIHFRLGFSIINQPFFWIPP